MVDPAFVELRYGDDVVRIAGRGTSGIGLFVSSAGVEGWRGTPTPKWAMTERSGGDGAFPVNDAAALYSARTVTIHVLAVGSDRAGVLDAMDSINRAAGGLVTVRICDGQDTFCRGLLSVEWGGGIGWAESGTVTVACPDPRRRSWSAHAVDLFGFESSGGGLTYGSGAAGLAYPLGYGASPADGRNTGTLANGGNAAAYPVIKVNGPLDRVALRFVTAGGSSSVEWDGTLGGEPVTLDCLSRTATIAGLDVSDRLSRRGFPSVPPGASTTFMLMGSGNGWAHVELSDTFL